MEKVRTKTRRPSLAMSRFRLRAGGALSTVIIQAVSEAPATFTAASRTTFASACPENRFTSPFLSRAAL